MKKSLALLALLALLAGAAASLPAQARPPRGHMRIVPGKGTAAPRFVMGLDEGAVRGTPADVARSYLRSNASLYGIANPARDLEVLDVIRTDTSTTVRFGQHYKGLEVFGAQYLVHLRKSASGYAPQSVNGHFFTELNAKVTPAISQRDAKRVALLHHTHLKVSRVLSHARVVLAAGAGIPAYHFTLVGKNLRGVPARQEVFVNSRTAGVALSYNNIHFAGPVAGTGHLSAENIDVPINVFETPAPAFELRDEPRNMTTHDALGADGQFFVPDDTNIVTSPVSHFSGEDTDSGAVDAHYGAGVTYDFYAALGRNSIDNAGMRIVSVVNAGDVGGGPLYNAFWDGTKMTYGNPDPSQYHPFSAGLDVVAHELTHGVTEFSGGLVYLNQSGAMNEAYSDYFGNAVENNVEGIAMTAPNAGYLGEDLCKVPNPDAFSCPLRDLNDGTTTTDFVYYMVDFDNGGVHLNSTIYAGTLWDIRENLAPATADALVYRALTEFTTPMDTFTDGRNSHLAAAAAMGLSDADKTTIATQFDETGIVEGWDTGAGNDALIAHEDIAPLGLAVSTPSVSGGRYAIGDYSDKLQICCVPEQIFVGKLDGSTPPEMVSDPGAANAFNDEMPDLSGKQAVWAHAFVTPAQELDFDLQGRKLGGSITTIIGNANGWQVFPSVSGNLVAWMDDRNGSWDIFARRIGGKQRKVGGGSADQVAPQVSGDWITWYDTGGILPKVKAYNFKTGEKIVVNPNGSLLSPPAAGGGRLAFFADPDNDLQTGVVSVHLAKKKVKTLVKESAAAAPYWGGFGFDPFLSINSGYVAFSDEFGFVAASEDPTFPSAQIGRDVRMVPTSGGAQMNITCNRGDQAFPQMGNGTTVAWYDTSQARTDLMWDTEPQGACA